MKLTELVDRIRLMDVFDVNNLSHENYEYLKDICKVLYMHGCSVGISDIYKISDIEPEFEKKFSELLK